MYTQGWLAGGRVSAMSSETREIKMLISKVRKVARCHVVTIPSDLYKMMGLQAGDNVSWELVGKKLVLTPIAEDKQESK